MSSKAAAGIAGGAAAGTAAGAAAAATAGGGPEMTNVSTSLLVIRSSGPVPFTIYIHSTDSS